MNFLVIEKSKMKLDRIVLLKNFKSNDHIYIGLGKENEDGNVLLSQVVGILKSELQTRDRWYMDFKFTTENAYCYFCNNDLSKSQECKFYFEAKTWGGKAELLSKTSLKDGEDYFKVVKISLKGGNIFQGFTLSLILHLLYFFIPIGTNIITLLYHLERMNQPSTPLTSYIGFYVTISVIYTYIILSNLHPLFNLGDSAINASFFILLIFALIYYGMCHLFGIPFFLNGKRIGTSKNNFEINPIASTCHVSFWVVWFALLCTFLADDILYSVFMSPFMYFFFTNIYILNIITNTIGGKTV
mmetsp:Transcript_25961/g.23003  ORF Transcript_25961/g.23003 Transcript_25961/m.23003 type:complete len:300 (+) Transcript_25961:337-1236(+)